MKSHKKKKVYIISQYFKNHAYLLIFKIIKFIIFSIKGKLAGKKYQCVDDFLVKR